MRWLVVVLALGACRDLRPFEMPDAAIPDAEIDGTPITGHVYADGGQLNLLEFAIVGDTRPPMEDDTAGYPKTIIGLIWQKVAAAKAPFAVTTGDYMYADPLKQESSRQLDIYLGARATYGGVVFPTMGNHECTGYTTSNCGMGNGDGITWNYQTYLQRMVEPLGQTTPWYVIRVDAPDKSWTSKFVFVAANAWNQTQADWLDATLSVPTTYTFVVRHEGSTATTAPGVLPSADIMAQHPVTLLIAGHTHTYAWYPGSKEVIVGNGGAPISGRTDYGYVLARMRDDGAIVFTARDYQSNTSLGRFVIDADGNEVP